MGSESSLFQRLRLAARSGGVFIIPSALRVLGYDDLSPTLN